MGLVTQEKGSLEGGVSQQSATKRPHNKVVEMQNCVPTLDNGLRLRNPSIPIEFRSLDDTMTQPTFPDGLDTVFVYEYDKGEVALTSTSYAFLITLKGGLEIVDMNLKEEAGENYEDSPLFTGLIYRDGQGINYAEPDDKTYLEDIQGKSSFAMTTVKDVTYVTNKNTVVKAITGTESTAYRQMGYLWIKQSEASTGWKYGATIVIKKADGSTDNVDIPLSNAIPKDTTDVAGNVGQKMKDILAARADVHIIGSLIRINLKVAGEEIQAVNAKDSFGDTASFGWGHTVDYQNQLPNSVGWFSPVVKVGTNDKGSFWLTHTEGRWKEYFDPAHTLRLDTATMPRVIERKHNSETNRDEYYVSKATWQDRLIGDNVTNQSPSFVGKTIKDLFFFRNRLGFMTESGISLSEVGFYGNFFRTSVAVLLDSDRIDAGVESLKSINLEYSILLEDSVILFADKAQFRFRGGQILSPASHEITQEMAYDVDIAVRPLFLDNKIFFVATRGALYSAIYEMRLSNNAAQNSYAIDLTADCQSYISGSIDRLTGSSVNKMVFASSHVDYFEADDPNVPIRLKRNTVFVYNFYDNGNERLQSAWHKWTWNGDLYSAFALGTSLFTMIKREQIITPATWIMSTGQWVSSKFWLGDGLWLMSPETLQRRNQLEVIPLQPFHEDVLFLDNYEQKIDARVDLGEWVYGAEGKRSPRGNLQFRTVQVMLSDDSEMELVIGDKRKSTTRRVVTADMLRIRKPYVGGFAKNVEMAVLNAPSGKGFRLDVVSVEGTITKRAAAH